MTFTNEEIEAMNRTSKGKTKPQGFTPKAKSDRPSQPSPPTPKPSSTAIPTARENALALSTQSYAAMTALAK
jgi:hypothetical protein